MLNSRAKISSFGPFDYTIFAFLLIGSASIGIFFGFYKRCNKHGKTNNVVTSREILLANKKMGLFPCAMSLLASFMSGITILGNPAEVYLYGTLYWWVVLAYCLVALATSQIFMPMFLGMENITSANEYLEKRFNRYVKLMASVIFILQMVKILIEIFLSLYSNFI
jgi:sodium-coupled monocarboxylate transporter 8/12